MEVVKVVAEGVQTQEEFEELRRLGCNMDRATTGVASSPRAKQGRSSHRTSLPRQTRVPANAYRLRKRLESPPNGGPME